jgi:hypothetical protein
MTENQKNEMIQKAKGQLDEVYKALEKLVGEEMPYVNRMLIVRERELKKKIEDLGYIVVSSSTPPSGKETGGL